MQQTIQPQLPIPLQHPCIIELPGGYRVYGQNKEHLNEGLSVLRENGIHFPSPTAHFAHLSSNEFASTPLVLPSTSPGKSEDEIRSFGYYKDLYLQRQNRSNINDETFASNCFILELAQDVLEDKSPKLIRPEDIEVLLDALEHLPLRAKKKLGAGMNYRSLIRQSKREKKPTISKSTQCKHITNFRAFIHWLMEARVISEDPTCAVNITDYQPKTKTKVSFEPAEVQEITHPKHEPSITAPQNHWTPLINLYTGLRLNETAQLYVDDILKVSGIWCFKVSSDRDGQSVKTASSVRYVPIHSQLIELGFLDYVEEVRQMGFDHLFPGQTWGQNGPGGNLSISLNKTHLRSRCGITDSRKTIGCLRHTFATLAAQSGLIPRVIKRIMGHAEDTSVLQKHYVDPAEVPECKEWIEKIEFPPIFANRYSPGRFDKHFEHIKTKEDREGRRLTTNRKIDRKSKNRSKMDND